MKVTASLTMTFAYTGYASGYTKPNYTSPLGVEIYNPDELFNASGPWSMMSKAGNTLYISGWCTDLNCESDS